jgi:hypothetical protein
MKFLYRVVTSGLSCPNVLLVPIVFRQYPSRKMANVAEDFMYFRMECTMLSESSGLFFMFLIQGQLKWRSATCGHV